MILQYNSENCIYRNKHPEEVKVAYGITGLKDSNSSLHETEKLIPHENYYSSVDIDINNIGLIKLKEKIVFNAKVKPVKLPTRFNLKGGYSAVTTGWALVCIIPA